MNFFLRLICIFIPGSHNRHRFKRKIKNIPMAVKMFLPSVSLRRQKFDFIVSLGDRCHISFQLRVNNLQNRSYPFDWLCKANVNNLIDLVNNNFQNFLDRRDLVPVGHDKYNLIVDNNRTGYKFMHDFRYDTIDEDYNIMAAKYDRRFDRFNKSVNHAHSVLFVYRNDNAAVDDIKQLHAALTHRFKSTKKINILWIVNTPNQSQIIKTNVSDGVCRATFDCDAFYGDDEIHRWEGNANKYQELFKQYALTIRGYFYEKRG